MLLPRSLLYRVAQNKAIFARLQRLEQAVFEDGPSPNVQPRDKRDHKDPTPILINHTSTATGDSEWLEGIGTRLREIVSRSYVSCTSGLSDLQLGAAQHQVVGNLHSYSRPDVQRRSILFNVKANHDPRSRHLFGAEAQCSLRPAEMPSAE